MTSLASTWKEFRIRSVSRVLGQRFIMPSASSKSSIQIGTQMEGNDIVKNALNIVEKKVRNLEKRKGKLDSYKKLINDGKELNEEQKNAVSKMGYVENNLDFARELQKQFAQLNIEYQKQLKKQAKRDQLVAQEAQHTGDVAKVKEVLELQNLMENLSEDVRTDFLNGSNGAVTLAEEDFTHIDDFYKLITPDSEGEANMNDQITTASEHIVNFLEASSAKVAGTTYKGLYDLVNKIKGCGYFSQTQEEAEAAGGEADEEEEEEEEKVVGKEAEEEAEAAEEVEPEVAVHVKPSSEEATNGIHSEGAPTSAADTTAPSQPISEPATNISSIGANEHGLNFLSESEVESKPQADQAQIPAGDGAPVGDGWEEQEGAEDNLGDSGFETVQSNNGFGRGGRGGFGRGGGRGGGGRGGNFNRRGGGDRGRRGGGRGGFGGGPGNRDGGFQRQDGNYSRGGGSRGGDRRGGRGFGPRGGGPPRGGRRGGPPQQ